MLRRAYAHTQVFNCGTDNCITYKEICELVAKTAGKTAKITNYDPKVLAACCFLFFLCRYHHLKTTNVLGLTSHITLVLCSSTIHIYIYIYIYIYTYICIYINTNISVCVCVYIYI